MTDRPSVRFVILLFALAVLVYLGLCAALYAFQRALIYYPQPRAIAGPASTMELAVADASLVVSVRSHDGPKALLYFGGNAEDVSSNLPSFSRAIPDHALYLMHYRGYGGSSGTPSEEALQRDALALFDRIFLDHPEIAVVGRSLGSGIGIWLASQRPATRLVLVTPYDSMQDLAASHFPYLPVRWLLRDKYESSRYAPSIRVQTLVISAEDDEVIPSASTARLLAAFAPGVAALKVISGAGHNTISNSPDYLEALRSAL